MELRELFKKLSNSDLSELNFDFANNSLELHFWYNENETVVKFNRLINFEYRPDFSDEAPRIILEASYKFIDLDSLLLNHKPLFIGGSRVYEQLNFPVIVSEFKSADIEIKIVSESISLTQI